MDMPFSPIIFPSWGRYSRVRRGHIGVFLWERVAYLLCLEARYSKNRGMIMVCGYPS